MAGRASKTGASEQKAGSCAEECTSRSTKGHDLEEIRPKAICRRSEVISGQLWTRGKRRASAVGRGDQVRKSANSRHGQGREAERARKKSVRGQGNAQNVP